MKRICTFLCLFVVLGGISLFAQEPPPPPPPPPMPTYPLSSWKEFQIPEAQFAIAFPIKPKTNAKTEVANGVVIEISTFEVQTGDGSYTVICTKLPQRREETSEQLKQRLRDMLKRLEQGKQYKWLGGKEIVIDGFPGIEFKYETLGGQENVWQRFYSVDDRIYRIISDTFRREPALKEPQIFHDSFKLLPPTAATKLEAENAPTQPLPSPAPRPSIQRVSGGVLQGIAIRKVQPPYPPEALSARASGAVQVAITVSEEGKVIAAEAVAGHPLLKSVAVEAAKQWTFKPTELAGVPVKLQGILTFNFTLQ